MIIFENDGIMDPRSIVTFGVSAKENDKAIGFFGTGLKYAIAILLREKQKITIISGGVTYNFDTQKVNIRDTEFEIITMESNGKKQELGFTTELGKNWKLWQAYRELHCNCTDEGGEVYYKIGDFTFRPKNDKTYVIVKGAAIQSVYSEREEIILSGTPKLVSPTIEIYNKESRSLYYRNIKAYELDCPSKYTYNFTKQMELTEDRTIKHFWDAEASIINMILNSEDEQFIKSVLLCGKEYRESSFRYDNGLAHTPNETFTKVVMELRNSCEMRLNKTAVAACMRHWNSLGPLQVPEIELHPNDKTRIQKSIEFLKKVGYQVDEYPIVCTEFLGQGVLGRASNDTIYLSRLALQSGTKMVASTILEEFIHLKYKLYDETRGMQNFLFEELVAMAEKATGEVL